MHEWEGGSSVLKCFFQNSGLHYNCVAEEIISLSTVLSIKSYKNGGVTTCLKCGDVVSSVPRSHHLLLAACLGSSFVWQGKKACLLSASLWLLLLEAPLSGHQCWMMVTAMIVSGFRRQYLSHKSRIALFCNTACSIASVRTETKELLLSIAASLLQH